MLTHDFCNDRFAIADRLDRSLRSVPEKNRRRVTKNVHTRSPFQLAVSRQTERVTDTEGWLDTVISKDDGQP
jgi:hypothetical protein